MIGLGKGEHILDQVKIQSKMGDGILYLLDNRIALEISGSGLCLELRYDEILYSESPKNNSLVISWAEGLDKYEIKFNVKNACDVLRKIHKFKNNFLI